MAELTALEQKIVEMIVEECVLPDLPADISPDDPILGDDSPFGLDSLDAVEIVVAVQKRFGVRIANQQTSHRLLTSLRTLSDYIESQREASA